MSKKKDQISVPIIKSGKDICRLIFTKKEDGRYDLKIEFLQNTYKVQTYRLFSYRPIVWDVDNPQQVNISYHHGENNRPIVIHLKDTKAESNIYKDLPATRLQAPNVNQKFPLPLLKIEIPDEVVKTAKQYRAKAYHQPIDVRNSNVVEIFLTPGNYDLHALCDKYVNILCVYYCVSMEYFATNTVISDYQKAPNFVPHGEPEQRALQMTGLDGMGIYAIFFPDPNLQSNKSSEVVATFIENEFAEDILLSTIQGYPKVNSMPGQYDGIFIGGVSVKQLKYPLVLNKPDVIKNSVAFWSIKKDPLSLAEKKEIETMAVNSRIRLYDQWRTFDKEINAQKQKIETVARLFMLALKILQKNVRSKYMGHLNDEGITINDVEAWLLLDPVCHADDIHMIFAKFLGYDRCQIEKHIIYSKHYKENIHRPHYNEKGLEIKEFRTLTPYNTKFHHAWMVYDDMFNVDLLRGSLNLFLGKIDGNEPDILVERGTIRFSNDNWNGMKNRLEKKGFICEPATYAYRNPEKFKGRFEKDNGLLNKIYDAINFIIDNAKELGEGSSCNK